MANEEHLKILRRGVETWNQWRAANTKLIPDLSGDVLHAAYFREAEIQGVDVSRKDWVKRSTQPSLRKKLRGANLREAILFGAVLNDADLRDADLTDANLSGTLINGADLTRANLANANLSGADIEFTDFTDTILTNTKFARVKFGSSIHLFSGKSDKVRNLLQPRDFTLKSIIGMADLSQANLEGFDLSNAKLHGVILVDANLIDVNLSNADLRNSNLTNADLTRAEVLGTNFTGAILTGTCVEDWNANATTNLSNVICEYIYCKQGDQDRRPSDPNRNFAPGEFTKLFQKALSTIDLIFRNGVDWDALLISLEKLRIEAEGAELSIQAIENKEDGAFVVRVNVPPEANKAEVERFLKREYDSALKILDEKYQYQLNAKDVEIESYRRENANLMEIARLMANRPINVEAKAIAESQAMGDTFNNDFQGAKITNFANKLEGNARQQAIVNNFSPEQKQNLAEAAAEIQQLLNQLAQANPASESAIVEAVHQEIKRNPTLKARLLGALKAGGLEALKAIFAHPVFAISAETVKGWLEAE